MAHSRTVVPLPDYERIFRVIYSVIDEHANTPHACVFFAVVGAAILELKYKLNARPVAGAAAFAVHATMGTVSTFGELVGNELQSSAKAFHCWVECEGVDLDFMAPLFRESLRTYGHDVPVPRRMFQRPLREMSSSVHDLRGEGAFYLNPNQALSIKLFESFSEGLMATDLANICLAWYAKPPKPLSKKMSMRDNEGNTYYLQPKGPALSGVW
jgi:hypothetical protein